MSSYICSFKRPFVDKKKIHELVEENYVFASVLFYFGIEFYEYSEETLGQVCQSHRLKLKTVVKALEEAVNKGNEEDLTFLSIPIELVVEYLKHSHHIFVKKRLPYIVRLVDNLKLPKKLKNIQKDLQFVLPLFVEDFIHHIYEEEDNLFEYVLKLEKARKGQIPASALYFEMEKFSIQHFAIEHEVHDDEMQGIRKITDNFSNGMEDNLHLKVVYKELEKLEGELKTHARIENDILFPKALLLEKEVKKTIKVKITHN